MPARLLQYRDVEKGIARAIAQLDEAEPLLPVEPFDHRVGLWSLRHRLR